jgi:hypothetical protein
MHQVPETDPTLSIEGHDLPVEDQVTTWKGTTEPLLEFRESRKTIPALRVDGAAAAAG